ncbi:MAG TPA: hypothetical protein VMT21_01450 [Gemmatimonadales bacterium]|nr:hypothetical protein [Gemmatimonadales bacterium]
MPGQKLSAKNEELVGYLDSLLKEMDHFAALVEQFAGAKSNADQYSSQLSRELAQLRQKAMMRNVGFVADSAGQLSVAASRGGSPMMKSRVLRDGVVSLRALIERTIKGVLQADEGEKREKEFQAQKAAKAQAEAVKKRVLEEEAKEAAKQAAAAAPPSGPAPAGVQPKVAPAPASKTVPAAPPKAVPAAAPAPAPRPAAAPAPRAASTAAPAAPRPAGPGTVKP